MGSSTPVSTTRLASRPGLSAACRNTFEEVTAMLDLGLRTVQCCQGLSRRSLLRAGVLGGVGLMLPDLLRADEARRNSGKSGSSDRSIILVWLDGGPPQHET